MAKVTKADKERQQRKFADKDKAANQFFVVTPPKDSDGKPARGTSK